MSFEVELPDGRVISVDAPDAASAAAAAKKFLAKSAGPAAPQPAPQMQPSFDAMGSPTGGAESVSPPSTMPYAQQVGNAVSKLGEMSDDMVRRAANTMSFNLADKVAARANATLGYGGYDQNLKQEREKTNAAGERLNVLAPFADLAGGLGLGAGLAKNGVSLLGRYGPRFGTVGNIGLGAGEGAAYGAAYGAGGTDTGNVGDYLRNAVAEAPAGAAFGGAIPAAVGGTRALAGIPGAIAQKLGYGSTDAFANMPDAAKKLLSNAMSWDRNTGQRLGELGDQAMLGDTGPAMRGLAQGVVTRPGEGASRLLQSLDERNQGRTGRLASDTEGALGPVVQDEKQAVEALKAQRNMLHDVELPKVFSGAEPIDPTPVVNAIENLMKTAKGPELAALKQARGMLVKQEGSSAVPGERVREGAFYVVKGGKDAQPPVLETDPVALNNVKVTLSGMLEHGNEGLNIPKGSLAKKEGSTKLVTSLVNHLLREKVPGYAPVMDQSSLLARRIEAVDTGYNALEGGKGAMKPREVNTALAASDKNIQAPGATSQEIQTGARARIDNMVGTSSNDLVAMKKALGGDRDWNRAKMEAMFGKEATERMLRSIDRESAFAGQFADVARGSQTANKAGGSAMLDAADSLNLPLSSSASGMALGVAKSLANRLTKARSLAERQSVRDSIGNTLALQGEDLNTFLRRLEDFHAADAYRARAMSSGVPGLLGERQ